VSTGQGNGGSRPALRIGGSQAAADNLYAIPQQANAMKGFRLPIAALALLLAPATAFAQVQTAPLPAPDEPATRPDRSDRQPGMVTFGAPGAQHVIIRSFEPTTVLPGEYRVDFEALDAGGDGFISRREASAHEVLARQFRGVDIDGDGRLSRDELRGWIR